MKNIFFTSDWHVGHQNVLDFDQRPFRDLDHMHRVLINNYNAAVGPDDICYFLGDFAMKCPPEKIKEVINQLNGTKVIVLGNHDRGMSFMYQMGFDLVLWSGSLVVGNQLVTFSHCPLLGVFRESIEGLRGAVEGDLWHGESRYPHFSVPDRGQFHLHGHIHSGPHNSKGRILGRQMDVGVAANNYRPVSLREVERWISLTLQAEGERAKTRERKKE